MATETHTNGVLSDEEWEVISDAVETLEIWSKQVFLDDKGCRPMWNPTLRRLRNLLATRTNRPVSFTLEQLSAYLDANTINYLRNRLITLASSAEQVHAPKTIVPEPDQRRIETERIPKKGRE